MRRVTSRKHEFPAAQRRSLQEVLNADEAIAPATSARPVRASSSRLTSMILAHPSVRPTCFRPAAMLRGLPRARQSIQIVRCGAVFRGARNALPSLGRRRGGRKLPISHGAERAYERLGHEF
jgi:hypothetical protein